MPLPPLDTTGLGLIARARYALLYRLVMRRERSAQRKVNSVALSTASREDGWSVRWTRPSGSASP